MTTRFIADDHATTGHARSVRAVVLLQRILPALENAKPWSSAERYRHIRWRSFVHDMATHTKLGVDGYGFTITPNQLAFLERIATSVGVGDE